MSDSSALRRCRGERGTGKKPKCRGDQKCHRCSKRTGCCLRKPTPCGKQGCLVCSAKEGCDDAVARAAAAQWQSSRSRRSTQKEAAAGSGSGEKKPKYATNAQSQQAHRDRKIKREKQEKKKKKEEEKQPDRGTCVSLFSLVAVSSQLPSYTRVARTVVGCSAPQAACFGPYCTAQPQTRERRFNARCSL